MRPKVSDFSQADSADCISGESKEGRALQFGVAGMDISGPQKLRVHPAFSDKEMCGCQGMPACTIPRRSARGFVRSPVSRITAGEFRAAGGAAVLQMLYRSSLGAAGAAGGVLCGACMGWGWGGLVGPWWSSLQLSRLQVKGAEAAVPLSSGPGACRGCQAGRQDRVMGVRLSVQAYMGACT